MATKLEEMEGLDGWDPVPPGHPGRAAYEARMRALGIQPATRWEPRHDRRVFRAKVFDGLRRVWEGPPPEALSDEEMQMIMRPRDEEEALPELVPPDDPERLAWEAYLRSLGIQPAAKWNYPVRPPLHRSSFWERVKQRVSQGW